MFRVTYLLLFLIVHRYSFCQLQVARDTISVFENGKVLKMPWANGINFSCASNLDVNFDGKKDLVLFDRINQFGTGKFRCFVNTGSIGETKYVADLLAPYYFPPASNWAILLDYNKDGREDIFCSTSSGIKVYQNTSSSNSINFTLVKPLLHSDYNPGGPPYMSNLYASSVGVPGISDIDKDGDLDILTFSPQGVFIEFHKNMSMEKYGIPDSLVFQIGDLCWGKISESNCSVTMGQCLQKGKEESPQSETKELHAGSCLTCVDSDGDGDEDLIMGDISCSTLIYAHNTGTKQNALFTDTTKLFPNYPTKNNTVQVKINNFPCTYYVDVNGDSKQDLIASPNAFGSENYKSVWYYKNSSLTSTVNFEFVKNNFLQDEMIEVGQNSYPILFDYNADGKKDLLIGTFGYYNNNSLNARLTLYENIGSVSAPVFSLITRDYANMGIQNLNNIMPTSGDIDGDGDIDLCIGVSSGQIHWLENTAGAGLPCNFSIFKNNPFNFTTASAVAAPQLFDLNNDGLLDLLIGGKNGRVAYYKNVGTITSPTFTLVTNFLGNIEVKGDPSLYGLDGYAAPFFYRENGSTKCLVGSVSGNIWYYLVPSDISSPFTLISNATQGLNEGGQSTVWFEDIDGDNKRDLFIGNGSGGLSFFSSSSKFVGVKNSNYQETKITIYPNPIDQYFNIQIDDSNFMSGNLSIVDISGRGLLQKSINSNFEKIDSSELSKGYYIIKFLIRNQDGEFYFAKPLIKY